MCLGVKKKGLVIVHCVNAFKMRNTVKMIIKMYLDGFFKGFE